MRKYAIAKRSKIFNARNIMQAWKCEHNLEVDVTQIRSRFTCEDQKMYSTIDWN